MSQSGCASVTYSFEMRYVDLSPVYYETLLSFMCLTPHCLNLVEVIGSFSQMNPPQPSCPSNSRNRIFPALMMLGVFIGIAALTVTGCTKKSDPSKDEANQKKQAIPVEVVKIGKGSIESLVRGSTNLEAEEDVKVFSRASNRVVELLVEEGMDVQKDQVLLRLENDLQRTQLSKAEIRLSRARSEFQRQKSLFDQQIVSEQVIADSQHELKQLELAHEDAKRDLDYTEVRAPIAGTITQRNAKLGDLVSGNQHLFTVVSFKSIVARLYRPEKELTALQLGQKARVVAPSLGEQVFEGYVQRISPIVESRTGTVKVTIGFKNVDKLRPGMYIDADVILSAKPDALLIPKRALVYDQDQRYVYRLKPGRLVERLVVNSMTEDKLNVEPGSGLSEGDEIVIAGQTGLKDGALVRLPSDPKPKEDPKDKGKS